MSEENTTVRYSDEELEAFRVIIEKKVANVKSELDYLREQIQDLTESSNDNQSGDWFDDSSLHSDIEMLSSMANRQQTFLEALEAALIRIKNKTYGICSVTGKLIDKKRLMVVPHATKSLEAKEHVHVPTPPKAVAPPKPKPKPGEPHEKKIITKVIKRSGEKSSNPVPLDDDDDFPLIDDPGIDFEDDDDDLDVDMDLEDIPDNNDNDDYED